MAVENLTRRCCDCHWYLPLICFYSQIRRGKVQLSSRCKDCSKLAANARYKERREDVLRVVTAYRLTHKSEIYLRDKSYRERNPEYIRRIKIEHASRPESRKRKREQQRASRAANREQYNEQCRKQRLKYPERRRVTCAKDRLRRRTAKGLCSLAQWLAKCEYFGWRCYLCGIALTSEITHMEHRKPLSRGGSHWPANLAPACRDCNLSKNNKTESEYRAVMKQHQQAGEKISQRGHLQLSSESLIL